MENDGATPVLSVFDFDGTLTYRDSFTLFLRKELGSLRYLTGLLGLALPAIYYLLRLISRDELKARLIYRFLRGISVANVNKLSDSFCSRSWGSLMRANGIAEVAEQLRQGANVTLCSASPELILAPFAKRLGVELIATRLEENAGVLTGAIYGRNCRQAEKVLRLEARYGDLSKFHIRAWGDSAGDKQLLESAAEPFYRAFHIQKPRRT